MGTTHVGAMALSIVVSIVTAGGGGANLAMAFLKLEIEHVAVSTGSIHLSSNSIVLGGWPSRESPMKA
eukprot:13753248-Ditylum_brightwellii.AAC.1